MNKSSIRTAVRSFRGRPAARLVPWGIDRLAALGVRGARDPRSVVVVVATGHGNIGDRAMLDAIVGKLADYRVTLVGEDTYAFDEVEPGSVNTVVLSGLLNGVGLKRFRAHRRFAALAARSSHVLVVGADLMDGLYNPRKSVSRLSVLRTAVSTGANARVTGFSWPPTPAPTVDSPTRSLSQRVDFYLRDPESFRRFESNGARGRLTADVVFTDERRDPLPERVADWRDGVRSTGGEYAVINVSGLIEKRLAQRDEYKTIINGLRDRGYRIVFLPHVVRETDGDSAVTREICDRFGEPADLHITELLRPSQVRELTRGARVVVTGRMHLAIMSLSQSTPAITLATQGKVEGLYSMFQLDQLAVEPKAGFGARVVALIDEAVRPETSAAIVGALPEVRSRANKNFEGLRA